MKPNLLETIKIQNGEALHLAYHQKRLKGSLKRLGCNTSHELHKLINPPKNGLYRCRFVYNETDFHVEYIPYTFSPVNSLKLVESQEFDYSLKYEARQKLDTLFALRGECDDILIVIDSMLTDTSKANVALYDGSQWITPDKPLLRGTTRERYLDEKKIVEKPLHVRDIANFEKVAVLNAMVDFCVLNNGIIA